MFLLHILSKLKSVQTSPDRPFIAHQSKLNWKFQRITVLQPVRCWVLIINIFQLPMAGYPFYRRVYWGNVDELLSKAIPTWAVVGIKPATAGSRVRRNNHCAMLPSLMRRTMNRWHTPKYISMFCSAYSASSPPPPPPSEWRPVSSGKLWADW